MQPVLGEDQVAIVDSGTSYLMMPKAPLNGFLSYLKVHQDIQCMEVS